MNESSAASSIIRLNVALGNPDDQIKDKLARIAASPINSDKVLSDIRSLVFRIPILEIEAATRTLTEKLLNVAIQTNNIPQSKEIENFRHELLSLLSTLNFKFISNSPLITFDKVTMFFTYISDGSISDLADALPVIRQTFESADSLNRQFLQDITKLTISSSCKRVRWLFQHYDSIDSSYFYPILTLLTVISFCARTFEQLREQFVPIFQTFEVFIAKELHKDKNDYSIIPLLALKARMIHCYSLSVETIFKNKPLAHLVDSYMIIINQCPSTYQLLHEEITWLFVCLITQKHDLLLYSKYIEVLPNLMNFTAYDFDYYMSRHTILLRLFETIIPTPKCNWDVIEFYINFLINSLFVNNYQFHQRISRFQKSLVMLFKKFKETTPQHYKYHFSILFALHHFIKSMDETTKQTLQTAHDKSNDFNDVQQIISLVQQMFESISKVLECILNLFDSLAECRIHNEKIIPFRLPNLPYSQIEVEYAHKVFIDLIFLLGSVRFLSGKCNFRFAAQCISSNPPQNSKMCVTHLKLLKCYDHIRQVIAYIFQTLPKILKKCFHPLFMQCLWNRFFIELFKKNIRIHSNISFVHLFIQDMQTFSAIIISILQLVIEEMNNPTKGSMVIPTTQLIIRKINTQPDLRVDMKDKPVIMIYNKVWQVLHTFQNRVEAILNVDDSISLIIEILNLFVTFFKQPSRIIEIITPRLVERIIIATNQRDIGQPLILFFEFANKFAGKNIEFQQVVDTLIRHPHCSIRALVIIFYIGKRNKKVVYNDPDRMRRLLTAILNSLAYATNEEKIILLKMMRKLPVARAIETNESGMKPRYFLDEGKLEIPAIDLVTATVNGIVELYKNKETRTSSEPTKEANAEANLENNSEKDLWESLIEYIKPVFGIENSIIFYQGFQNITYNQKFVYHLLPLLDANREMAFSLFLYFSKEVIAFLAHFLTSVIISHYSLDQNELSQLFSVIDTQMKFASFTNMVSQIVMLSYPNIISIPSQIAKYLISHVSIDHIDVPSLSTFVAQIVTNRYLPKKQPLFPGKRFKFCELEILPPDIQDLIEKTKEIMRSSSIGGFFLLQYLPVSNFRFTRYTYGELLSSSVTEEQMTEFLDHQFTVFFHSNPFHLMKIAATSFRIFPSLIDKYIDQLDSFLKTDTTNLDKEKQQIINEILCAIVRTCPDFINKFENRFYEIFCNPQDFVSNYIPLIKSIHDSLPDTLLKKMNEYYTQRLRDDGIDCLITWETIQSAKITSLGKWDKISLYWPIFFILLPSEAAPTALRHLVEVVKSCSEQGFEIFREIAQLLVNEEVICHLVSENKYETLMSVLVQGLTNYNLAVDHRDLRMLIDSLAFANDAGIRYLRAVIRLEKKFSLIQIAFEEEEYSRNLKEIIFSEIDLVQTTLKVEQASYPTHSQYLFAAAALSDENILMNPELYDIVFHFFIDHIPTSSNCIVFVEHFVNFIYKNISKLVRSDVILALTELFNVNSQIILTMIFQLINEITKENSEFKIHELASAKLKSIDIALVYLKAIIVPYIKNKNCQPEDFLRIENCFPYFLYLHATLHFMNEIPNFSITSTKAFELYNKCSNDKERHVVFEIWSHSKEDGHFEEMFKHFLNGISVYISSHQKRTCESIRFPKDCSVSILEALVKSIISFQKSPPIFVILWQIFANNLSVIPNPLSVLWNLITLQVLNLKQFAKKPQVNSLGPLIEILTQLICSSQPPDNKDHQVIIFFANFVMYLLRYVIEQPQSTIKGISPIIKSALKLVKRFGPQVNIVNTFFKYAFEFYQKNLQKPIDVFPILMHFASKMLKYAILYDESTEFDAICEMLFTIICEQASPSWPSAYTAINTLLSHGKCVSKIYSLLPNIPNDEIWIRFSSILWKYDFPEEIRSSKLLPFARKIFNSETADTNTGKFMLTCFLVTIINYPHGDAIRYLIQDLKVRNSVFHTFFLKYFVILNDIKKSLIITIGEILKAEKFNLDSNESANPELKKYISAQKKKKTNKFLYQLEGHINERYYKKLTSWNLSKTLPEFLRNDYMDSLDKFSPVKTSIRHNLHSSIIESLQLDVNNVPSKYADSLRDCFKNINTITNVTLVNAITDLNNSLHPISLYTKEFARFYAISSALKKNKPYSKPLSSFFSPLIHQSMMNFVKRMGVVDNSIHDRKFTKSMQLSFCENKPLRPSLTEFDENDTKSIKNLILSFSSTIRSGGEWNEILYFAVQNGLKLSNRDPIFLSTLFQLLPYLNLDYVEIPTPLDPIWSSFLIDFISEKQIKKVELMSFLHPSVLLGLLNENGYISEPASRPFSVLRDYILSCDSISTFDFPIDIPFISGNDKIGLIATVCSTSLTRPTIVPNEPDVPFEETSITTEQINSALFEVIQSLQKEKKFQIRIVEDEEISNTQKREEGKDEITNYEEETRRIIAKYNFTEEESEVLFQSIKSCEIFFDQLVNDQAFSRQLYSKIYEKCYELLKQRYYQEYKNKNKIYDDYRSFVIRGKSGILYKYLVTSERPMNSKFALVNHCINYFLKKYGGTRERGISLPSIQSLKLNENLYISKCEFLPLAFFKPEPITTKRENILWRSLIHSKIGALSALNISLNAGFDTSRVLVDEKNAILAIHNAIQKTGLFLPLYIDRSLVEGPYKNGIISTFLSFTYYRDEVRHFLNSAYDVSLFDQVLEAYSIPYSSAEQVNRNIDSLLEVSLPNETVNSVSWF